jgi:uncharacterized membrane protein
MQALIVLLLLVVIVGVTAVAAIRVRRLRAALSAPPEPLPDPQAHARRAALEPQENALLARRVALDTRRGPLGGDSALDTALGDLEARYHAGQIDEEEFEREKVRLLSE